MSKVYSFLKLATVVAGFGFLTYFGGNAAHALTTTNPSAYPTYTITSQRTETTTKTVHHPATKTTGCAQGGGSTGSGKTSSTYTTTTVKKTSTGTKTTTTTKKVADSQTKQCNTTVTEAYDEEVTVKTTYYTMELIPFAYTPKTTVDKSNSKPGDKVTFSHRITIASGNPPTAVNPPTLTTVKKRTGPTYSYNYGSIQTALCNLLPSSCYKDSRDAVLPTYSGKKMSYDTAITIGKDTPDGAKICYNTKVDPATEQGNTVTDTSTACTTVGTDATLYNLLPSVSLNSASPAEPGEPVNLADQVQNTMKDTSPSSTWTAFAIRVGSGVDVAPITTTTHDDTTPAALATSLGTQASGQPNAIVLPSSDTSVNKTGTATFGGNSTTTVGTRTFILPEDAPVGTKFCFFLSVTPAASSGTPTTRTSAAKCMTIGIKPKLNVYGGDLSVGRRFATDTSTPEGLKSVINTSLTAKNQDGTRKVFGSWTEYDAYAPGTVTGFGTASGLQGGYATASTDQAQWSKLSFVNVRSTYGTFTNSGALGTIPDIAASVTNGLSVAETLPTTTETIDLNTKTQNGIYKKDTGNLTLTGTTLGANRTVVVAAPRGTVTIAGNLQYHPGPYTSPTQIPQLLIIAKNIVIQAPVTTIDAWLIAKTPLASGTSTDPNDVSGRITTCDTPGNLSTTTCNQRLTITGPVMSNQLVLRRTAGFATGDDAPAEIFNLRADAALWIYQQGTGGTPRPVTTDSKDLPVRF